MADGLAEGWRFYYARGRGKVRLGVRRKRVDRACPEYRFVELGCFV